MAANGDENVGVFSLKSLCVITGASRGLGKAIAVNFASKFHYPVSFVLVARNLQGLNVTADLVKNRLKELQQNVPVNICTRAIDLGQTAVQFDAFFPDILKELDATPGDFEQVIIVHCAGSLGDVSKRAGDFLNTLEIRSYYDLNLTNVVALNSHFLKTFSGDVVKRIVINISSLCAIEPFKTWSLYCAVKYECLSNNGRKLWFAVQYAWKAARDMYFRVLGREESPNRTCVLNYAPGPLDTDMGDEARIKTADKDIKKMFEEFQLEGKNLKCETSVEKLVKILQKMKFTSGDHVDYFDEI